MSTEIARQIILTPLHVDLTKANCASVGPGLFDDYGDHSEARQSCMNCSQITDCYIDATVNNMTGTWGGVFFHNDPNRTGEHVAHARRMTRFHVRAVAARLGLSVDEFVKQYGPGAKGLRRAIRAVYR